MISLIKVSEEVNNPKSIPVIYNVHKHPWSNITGDKFFYIPTFEFVNPTPNQDLNDLNFSFDVYSSDISGNPENLQASVNFKVKKGKPSYATDEMLAVPSNLVSSLMVPYFDENKILRPHIVYATIKEFVDSLYINVNLSGKWVSLCYGAISGMDKSLPPPVLNVGALSVRAYVPSFVEPLNKLDDPSFEATLELSDPPDLNKYNLFDIYGFVQTSMSILVPCSTNQKLYKNTYNNGFVNKTITIGCKQPDKIGRITAKQYEEITELNKEDYYRVFRSTENIERFLIVPYTYRIGLQSLDTGEEKAYLPNIWAQATIGSSQAININFIFKIMLLPDIPPYMRKELNTNIHALSSKASIEYPTQLDFKYSINLETFKNLEIVSQSVGFHLSISLNESEALVFRDIIYKKAAHGKIYFESIGDDMSFQSTIILEMSHPAGPWSSGPIEVIHNNTEVKLTNKTYLQVNINSLLVDNGSSGLTKVPVSIDLEKFGSDSASQLVNLSENPIEVYPIYSLVQTDELPIIPELFSYVNDFRTNIKFSDSINHQIHQIDKLEVLCKINSTNTQQVISMTGNPPSGNLDIILPLTGFTVVKTIEFQVKIHFISTEIKSTDYIKWDISEKGNIINLTWDMIESLLS